MASPLDAKSPCAEPPSTIVVAAPSPSNVSKAWPIVTGAVRLYVSAQVWMVPPVLAADTASAMVL